MRVLARVLVTLVVLVLAFVVADRVGVYVAEDRAEAALAGQLGGRPDVEIHGFPFLTQWGQGSYRDVAISAKQATVSGTKIDGPVLTLSDVHTAAWAHAAQDFAGATAGTVKLSGTVPYASLPLPAGVTAKRNGKTGNDVRLSGAVSLLGQRAKFRAVAAVALRDGRITLSPRRIHFLGDAPSSVLTSIARDHLSVSVRPPHLPGGISVTGVTVVDKGLRVTATGHDVKLPHS